MGVKGSSDSGHRWPLHNFHYLNALGSPRSTNQRKFSEALMHKQDPPAPRLEAPRPVVRPAHLGARPLHANLPDSTINVLFLKRPESLTHYTYDRDFEGEKFFAMAS